jgi:sortase A
VNIVMNILSLALIGVGMALICTFFFPSAFLDSGSENQAIGAEPGEFNVPDVPESATAERQIEEPESAEEASEKPAKKRPVYSPKNKTLVLTIPAMARIRSDEIPTGTGEDEDLFRNYAAVHLEGTGFPWQKGANVYIAGHRLGYPGTESFLTFADLNRLESGDKVRVRDANGRRYEYEVFKKFVVGPAEVRVTAPVKGKNLLTLQTCTLPDYSKRLIVRAERVA